MGNIGSHVDLTSGRPGHQAKLAMGRELKLGPFRFAGAKGIYHHLAQTLDPGLAQTAVVDYGRQNDLGDREDLPNRAMQRVGQNCRIWTVAAEAV